jgi:hypothetical protein
MLARAELIALGIVTEKEIGVSIRPSGWGIVDVPAERPRQPPAVVDALNGEVQSHGAGGTSHGRLLDSNRIRDVLRYLVNDELEATAIQDGVVLVAEDALHPERVRVESRDSLQILYE